MRCARGMDGGDMYTQKGKCDRGHVCFGDVSIQEGICNGAE